MTGKVEPTTLDMKPRGTTRIFKILKIYLAFSGFYPGFQKSPKWCKLVLITYTIFCNLLALYAAFRVYFLYNRQNTSEALMIGLPYYIFFTEVLLLTVTLSITIPKYLPTFITKLQTRLEKTGCDYSRQLKILTYSLISLMSVLCLVISCASVAAVEHIIGFPEYHPIFGQFYKSPLDKALIYLSSSFGTFGIYVIGVLFNVVGFVIYKEFDMIARKFQSVLTDRRDQFDVEFQELWNDHISVCELLNIAEGFLKHSVVITYCSVLPILCFMVNALIRQTGTLDELGFMSSVFIYGIIQLTDITFVGVCINEKAHAPLQVILQSPWTPTSDKCLQKMSMMVTRLSTQKIGFSAYGLFTIDRSTVTMLFGTLLTYALVIMQF